MTSVTLDSNAYVSALEFGGIAARFLGMAQKGALRIDASDAIIDETIGVLRVKFGWDGYRLHFIRLYLLRLANRVSPTRTVNVVADPDDNRILECAVEAGSDFIITADKDLLRVGSDAGIRIIRAADFPGVAPLAD